MLEGHTSKADAAIGDAALLDVNQVAGLLNCSPRHIYRMADADKMPQPVRLGSLVRWPRQSVLAWIADGCPPVRTARGAKS